MCCETLILAAGLTAIISRMPTPPGKMKKTNHYVQWQQLKAITQNNICWELQAISLWSWAVCQRSALDLSCWALFGKDFNVEPKTQPTQTDTNTDTHTARWKALTQWAAWEPDTSLWDCALVRGWVCVFVCIFLQFAFGVFVYVCVCVQFFSLTQGSISAVC